MQNRWVNLRQSFLVALLLVSGCNRHGAGQTDGTAQSSGRSADNPVLAIGTTAWPKSAPAYAPAYPGATVAAVMTDPGSSEPGAMITFVTPDAPALVIEYYLARAKAAGLTQSSTMDVAGQRVITMTDPKSGRAITVQASVKDGKTVATLVLGEYGDKASS